MTMTDKTERQPAIDYVNLPIEELEELRDILYRKIDDQLNKGDELDKLLEYERLLNQVCYEIQTQRTTRGRH